MTNNSNSNNSFLFFNIKTKSNTISYIFMSFYNSFNLVWTYSKSKSIDNIIFSTNKPDISIFIFSCIITCKEVSIMS